MSSLKIIECPRDAMQGLHDFIPTDHKIKYINQLLKVGYDTIDFGSFVSPKAIPQMADTAQVLAGLDLTDTSTKLLAIVANLRGAEEAVKHESISFIGFPFSISETFQLRNTNTTMAESFDTVKAIADLSLKYDKQFVVYISMGFGNPYGDIWNAEICIEWIDKIRDTGVKIFSLSDTVGVASPDSISYIFKKLIPQYPDLEFGAHLHTQPNNWQAKVHAAYQFGCRRFDAAIRGYGGCPMAKDDLTGNMPTENLISYAQDHGIDTDINISEFITSMVVANEIFPK